jgi:hypothetical protein
MQAVFPPKYQQNPSIHSSKPKSHTTKPTKAKGEVLAQLAFME